MPKGKSLKLNNHFNYESEPKDLHRQQAADEFSLFNHIGMLTPSQERKRGHGQTHRCRYKPMSCREKLAAIAIRYGELGSFQTRSSVRNIAKVTAVPSSTLYRLFRRYNDSGTIEFLIPKSKPPLRLERHRDFLLSGETLRRW